MNVGLRGASQHIRHIRRLSGRPECGTVGNRYPYVAEPALMRARQVVGRDEPPGLRTGVAEGVHHAAWNEDERTGFRLDPGLSIEEGESALQDEVRFLLD